MRLKTLQVFNYKTISDTGEAEIRRDVTCLLGKNESGKSAVLQALWKSKNVAGGAFDMLYDYPKERYSRDRRANPLVTSLLFEFEAGDLERFRDEVGGSLPRPVGAKRDSGGAVLVETHYDGTRVFRFDLDHGSLDAASLVSYLDKVDAETKTTGDEPTPSSLPPAVAKLREALGDLGNTKSLREAASALLKLLRSEERATIEAVEAASHYQSETEARAEVEQWLEANIPDFIYFDVYGLLETRIHLPSHIQAAGKAPPDPRVRTQMALFEWAGIDPREILQLGRPKQDGEGLEVVQRRKEERATLLESASYALSGDWETWWSQRRHQLHIEADGDDLVLKVSDSENPWKVDFQERSRGFQWFFSFYLTFLVESQKSHRGAILLLDEPGLHLHISAQQDLLGFFQRVAEENQVLYSSHSPFMIDPSRLENVRTVFRQKAAAGERLYTRVSPGTEPEGDRDTLLPMQATLGYELSQTLFLGKKTLIVEGLTDYCLLKALSHELASAERDGLPEDIVVIFAGGTSRVVPLVSLFARPDEDDKRLVVLLDADRAGLDKANKLKRDMLRRTGAVALMSDPDLLNLAKAEVEDVVERAELLAAVESHRGKPTAAPTPEPQTNVSYLKSLYEANGWGTLSREEKAALVLKLVDTWRGGSPPSTTTLDRASKVIAGLVSRFS